MREICIHLYQQSIALIIPDIFVYSDSPRRDIDLSRGQKMRYIAKHVTVLALVGALVILWEVGYGIRPSRNFYPNFSLGPTKILTRILAPAGR